MLRRKKGANGAGIQSRKLSPATVGKGRGDGEMELVQRKDDKRKAKVVVKPIKDKTVTAKVSRPPLKNKGGPVSKKPKGAYAAGGMPMVMKGGVKVPAFAADGKGKMNMGGMAKKKPAAKMMAGGMAAKKKPAAKKMMAGGMAKKSGYMYGGMAKKKK